MANNSSNIFFAALSGAVVGTVIGLLFAPKTGEDTRRVLINKKGEVLNIMNKKIDVLKESHQKLCEDLKVKFKEKHEAMKIKKEDKKVEENDVEAI